jgi:predicted nucleotidyltransferase
MQRQEILDYLRKLKKDSTIFSSFILFGSYAREDNRKDSDIDYFDTSKIKRVRFPNLKKTTKSISIRLLVDMLDELKGRANN